GAGGSGSGTSSRRVGAGGSTYARWPSALRTFATASRAKLCRNTSAFMRPPRSGTVASGRATRSTAGGPAMLEVTVGENFDLGPARLWDALADLEAHRDWITHLPPPPLAPPHPPPPPTPHA